MALILDIRGDLRGFQADRRDGVLRAPGTNWADGNVVQGVNLREIGRRDEEKLPEEDFGKYYPCGLGLNFRGIC